MSPRPISVLGLGAMGSRVAARLLEAGHDVAVWNRTASATTPLQARGAIAHPDPSLAVADARLVLVCVRDDAASAAVWGATDSAVIDGTPRLDLSTITPSHAERLARSFGSSFLASPMVGSRPQIEAGQLTLFVGGPSDTLERVRPVLDDIAGAVHHVGDAADAARLKLVINGLFAAQLAVAGELLDILRTADTDLSGTTALLSSLPVTSPALARSLPRILEHDTAPNFPLELVAKDLDYLIQQADHRPPVLDAVLCRVRARGSAEDIVALAIAQQHVDRDRTPLFCDTGLAERLERIEADFIAEASRAAHRRRGRGDGFIMPIAGGVATFAEPGSPFNKVAGLGFAGVPSSSDLDEIEQAFAALGADVQVELSHLGDPCIGTLLTGRGYRLTSFENVLGRTLDREIEPVTPPGVQVRRSDEDELDVWLELVVDGFAHPDTQGVLSHEDFPRDVVERAQRDLVATGVDRYLALCDSVPAAGAGLRVADGVAQLAGSATAPAHRRRGIQSVLLAARLKDAAAAGCDIAAVTTQPGSKSQQNVQRREFDLLYTRAVLIKGHERAVSEHAQTRRWLAEGATRAASATTAAAGLGA